MIEILSPAGDFQSVEAAVRSGADAVYLGLSGFNARRNAKNFTEDSLKNTVEYCHIRGVKVHITLNTLVFNDEFEEALRVAKVAAECSVDALIVQDLGLAKAIHSLIPEIELHASTQLSVHSPSALLPLKKLGFSRVVVARETDKNSLKEICKTAKTLGMEIEAFVHGALCMCVSGQCYLSAMLGGRSGNRGLCAQPCRLPFEVEGGTGHDLSLKDLSLVSYISEMAEIGVCSLKIEGRMKRPEYVSIATKICRLSADGKPIPSELFDMLNKIFSRNGFTDGYYTENIGKSMFGTRPDDAGKLTKEVINKIHNIYRNELQRVPVSANLTIKENCLSLLTLSDGANSVSVKGDIPQIAKTAPVNESFAKTQISKLGGTPYYLESFELIADNGLMLPASEIGKLKRKAVEVLNEKRKVSKNYKISDYNFTASQKTSEEVKYFASFRDISQIPNNLPNISAIILPLENGATYYKTDLPLFADIPRGFLSQEDKIRKLLSKAKENGISGAFCGNIAAIEMCRECGVTPIANFGMNICNYESLNVMEALSVNSAVLSFENFISSVNEINGNIEKGIICYGKVPLMLTKNCPNKNGAGCKNCRQKAIITDRLGIEFNIACRFGFSELYNSRPIYIIDRMNEFNVDFAVLYFTFETSKECEEVINNINTKNSLEKEYTRGLYYKQVK